jgi:hypothetical protein
VSTGRQFGRLPLDVLICALLIGGCGLVYLIAEAIRLLPTAGAGSLAAPIVVAVLLLGAAAAVVAGLRPIRPAVLIVLILATLLQLLFVMDGGLLWRQVVSAILAAAQVYALVLLNTKPVREHFGLI